MYVCVCLYMHVRMCVCIYVKHGIQKSLSTIDAFFYTIDWDRAQELYAKICKREGKAFSPMKKPPGFSSVSNAKSNGNVIKKPVNKKSIYDDGDDTIGDGVGASSVWESRGTIGI